jgi:hypothetical protein
MSEETIPTTWECDFSVINIPRLAAALSVLEREILNASLLLPKMQVASISLEETIKNSQFIKSKSNVLEEATALKQSVRNLNI